MAIRVLIEGAQIEVDTEGDLRTVINVFGLRRGAPAAENGQHQPVDAPEPATTPPTVATELFPPPSRPRSELFQQFLRKVKRVPGWPLIQTLAQLDSPVDSGDLLALASVPKASAGGYWTGLKRCAAECGLDLEAVVIKDRRVEGNRYVFSYRLTPEFRTVIGTEATL